MLNQCTVIGRVTEVLSDRDATIVVVKTGGGQKRDGGEWEELVACRFWDKAKKWTEGIAQGQVVKVDGAVKSRKSEKGGYFSSLDARYLQKLEQARASSGGTAPPPSGPPDDTDNVPF